MDRSFKGEDLVHVHQSSREGECLATFRQAPYTRYGYDYYTYNNRLHYGFERYEGSAEVPVVFILLDKPVPIVNGVYAH